MVLSTPTCGEGPEIFSSLLQTLRKTARSSRGNVMTSYDGPETGSCEAVSVVPRTLTRRRAVQRMNLPRGMLVFEQMVGTLHASTVQTSCKPTSQVAGYDSSAYLNRVSDTTMR